MDEPVEPAPSTTNPAPFVIALVFVTVAAVLGFFLLREDEGELLRPASAGAIEVTGERTVSVSAFEDDRNCVTFRRAQVEYDDERIYLEFVVDGVDDCPSVTASAEVTLPDPVDGRDVVPGVGRFQLPCTPVEGAAPQNVTCSEDG